jgi:uncharacterized protein (TIGR03067 family)
MLATCVPTVTISPWRTTIRPSWRAFVLVVFISTCGRAHAGQGSLPSATLKAVKKSTAYLRVTVGNDELLQGSGFFASEPRILITNAHVVGMLKDPTQYPQRIDVVLNSGETDERTCLAEVIGVDIHADLAVLRVEGEDLPPPLKLVAVSGLEETQEVYVLGFPFGKELGKQITVSKSSISSLRKDESGTVERIQVNGGMHPGNSGGPVVDGKRQVVGVAVSGLRNTQIHFAVSADRVQSLLRGRVASIHLGRPRPNGDKFVVPVSIHLNDPLGRIQKVSLESWVGAKGKPRPSSSTPPTAAKGDASRQSLPLSLKDGVASGKWTLPAPTDTQVIWFQPHYVGKSNENYWAEATIFRPLPPEEDEKADTADSGAKPVDEEKRQAAAEAELKRLEGTWKLVRRETRGDLEPDIDKLKLRLLIEDGKFTWTKDEKDTGLRADVELDPTTSTRRIDIEFNAGALLGQKRLGIYELKGDKLVICWNKADLKRPKKFTTKLAIGSGTVHETYQRIED